MILPIGRFRRGSASLPGHRLGGLHRLRRLHRRRGGSPPALWPRPDWACPGRSIAGSIRVGSGSSDPRPALADGCAPGLPP